MPRRKSNKTVPFITPNDTETEESPWQAMLENASASRRFSARHQKSNNYVMCPSATLDFTELNPEEILLALENAGLYDIVEARKEALLQL